VALTSEDIQHLLTQLADGGDLVVVDEETGRTGSGPEIGISLVEGRIHISLRHDDDVLRAEVVEKVLGNWNEAATAVAADALSDILDTPDNVRDLAGPIIRRNDYWLEQLARTCFDLPEEVDYDGDWRALLDQIGDKTQRTKWTREGF
jgi:hypothetical protein